MLWRDKKVTQIIWERNTLWWALKRHWHEANEVAFYARFDPTLTEREIRIWSNRLLAFMLLVGVDILTDEEETNG